MNKLKLTVILLFAVILAGTASTQTLRIGGYYKSFFTAYKIPLIDAQIHRGQVSNRVRLNAIADMSRDISFESSYNFIPTVTGDSPAESSLYEGLTLFGSNSYRIDDFNGRLYPGPGEKAGSFQVMQNLDRAFFTVHTSLADIYLGRQAIAWGSARVINPTDILAPYSYNELDTEDRVGVDAVRIRYPLGFMGEIDAGAVFGDKFDKNNSAFFLRGKYYILQTDLSAMAIRFRQNLMLGLDLARSLGGAGTWLELSWVKPNCFGNDALLPGRADYVRGTIGADYSFNDKFYGFAEYHYNGAGTGTTENYPENALSIPYYEGGVFLLGEHYLIPGGTYQITPLLILNGTAIFNINDQSILMIPSLEYNISENIYLALGAYWGLGEKIATSDSGLTVKVKSEFGEYANTVYSSFRVYF